MHQFVIRLGLLAILAAGVGSAVGCGGSSSSAPTSVAPVLQPTKMQPGSGPDAKTIPPPPPKT
ncbi:hypothetical protein FRUB_01328 [Fimbriiglobus ruber]|uniref:Uncharacterized protein n=2 Tax=Fimbriiglobus ruber TaxID=1908690 RepID=A0A225E998_9BACT|nr:hypothetical protein FRUB_01328 [Fimbriiglobus ruber]